jgi:Ca-activated chloride channel homolog
MADEHQATATIDTAGGQGTGGQLVASDGRYLPLRGITLSGDAHGGLARIVLEQRFHNPHQEALRVSYQVPLPVDGAVAGYVVHIGDRRIVGEVERIEAARERFETSLVEGKSAALVEQTRPNLFNLEIGNIPPGVEVLTQLTVDQRLTWLGEGAWEWRFPTVVAPRYLGAEGHVADADRVSVDVAPAGVTAGARVALTIRDLMSGGAPTSPSHSTTAAPISGGVQVTLAGAASALDRDVVVRWPSAGHETGLTLDTGRPAANRPHAKSAYGLLTVVPPLAEGVAHVIPRDLILLIDTSGSMGGAPLEQAKAVARAVVESLDVWDQIELIQFSSQPRRWRGHAEAATDGIRRKANAWIDALAAEGGTEMHDGLKEALRPLRNDAQRQVVLITDGLIGFESEIVAHVARTLPAGSRLHAVGVGSAPNRALTAPVARAGRGVEVVIGLDEEVKPHVTRLIGRMRAPLLTEIKVSGSALLAHTPAAVPDVFAGAPLRLALELLPEGGELNVTGRTPAGAWEGRLSVPAVGAGEGSAAVVSLFGREAVEDLEVKRAAGENVDREVERIGLEFQIATDRTSWIAVSEEPAVDPTQPARRVRVPHALAHGLSIEGLGLRPHDALAHRVFMAKGPSHLPTRLSFGLRSAEVVKFTERRLSMSAPSAAPDRPTGPPALEARLVLRKDRELTFEIDVEAPLDWRPGKSIVRWSDGKTVAAEIIADRTTTAGLVTPGLTVRLTLRVADDNAAAAPVEVMMPTQHGPLTIRVRRA